MLAVAFSGLDKEIYIHGSSDVKFYIVTFQKKNMICKTSFSSHESPCLPLQILKQLNKREERRNNVGKAVVIFPQIFCEMLSALVRLLGITKA